MAYIFIFFSLISFAQLEKLDELAGKKLVALGESGHAVAEFHNSRAKISKVLIEKHGFRNILVEEDLLAGFKIIEAIDSCRGPNMDPVLVKKAFLNFDVATYRHAEFYAFYDYLCQWNQAHPTDPVRLSGIDVWSSYWDLRLYLENEILPLNIPALSAPLTEATSQCFLWSINNLNEYPTHPDWIYYSKYQRIEPTRHANCLAALYSLNSAIKKNAQAITAAIGEDRLQKITMAQDTVMAQQNIRDAYAFDFPKAMSLRDALQARNVLAHLKLFKTDSPTIFMAHNVHVFQKMSTVIPREIVTPYPWAHVISAGEWLKGHYGDQMAVIGIGGYDLQSARDGQYPIPTSSQSLDLTLHNEGFSTILVKAPEGQWWVHNETENEGLWVKPQEQFDYYFFIDKSGPATKFDASLITGKAQEPQVLY